MDEAEIPVTSYGWIQHDPGIRRVGAVRTRMPEVQIRFEGCRSGSKGISSARPQAGR